MNDNWTSHDDDNDGVASQTTSSSTRGQQLATGEYCWTESIKRPSPHLKLYANLPQIQSLNLMTAPAFAAPLRVLQHKQINIMIDLVNFTIICNSSTKENYIFISCIFNQLYMTHVHGSSCTLPSIYVSLSCIQSLCWINIHISKDSFPGFLQVLLRPFIVLLNIIVPGWNWTSVINRRKFAVDCAVVEVPKDLRLDLKRVQKMCPFKIGQIATQLVYRLDLDHQPHRGFHRVRGSECFIVHVNTFLTSQQQTVVKPWEA